MKHTIILTISIAAGLASWLFDVATGYFANPALFFSIFTPLVVLPLLIVPLIVAIGYGLAVQNPKLKLAAVIGLAIQLVGFGAIDDWDAFVYRMKSFSEEEYRELAISVKRTMDQRRRYQTSDLINYNHQHRVIYQSLVDDHPILEISQLRPKFSANESRVHVMWGSGLIGGYEAVILLAPAEPGWHKEPTYSSVTYIYDSVALLRLP